MIVRRSSSSSGDEASRPSGPGREYHCATVVGLAVSTAMRVATVSASSISWVTKSTQGFSRRQMASSIATISMRIP